MIIILKQKTCTVEPILQSVQLAFTERRYIGIHNFHHIKTYVFKQNHLSRRATDDRPYI